MFKGSLVALITPMLPDGEIDKKTLCDLIEWHISEKTDGIVAAGTTGESATLNKDEHDAITAIIIKQVKGRIPVIVGAGTNSTQSSLSLAENAKKNKADGLLLVTPYYNKPPQQGLYEHFAFIAKKIDLPIILYNVPTRTACDLLPVTVEKLSQVANIIGIKEATGKLERALEIKDRCHPRFLILSGDDPTALQLMLNGAQGVISVTANIVPQKMHDLCALSLNAQKEAAQQINDQLALLHQHLFIESNPIPTKWALQQMGKINSGIRLPLVPLDKSYHHKVKEALQKAGVDLT